MIRHWFFFKRTLICHQLEDLSIKLASWTLWNFAGWPKCLTKIITHEWHDLWVIKSMPKSDSEIGTFFLWLIQPWFHDFSDFQLFFIGNVGFGVSQSIPRAFDTSMANPIDFRQHFKKSILFSGVGNFVRPGVREKPVGESRLRTMLLCS